IGVDKNTTVVFPAPLMSTIGELGSFLARETAAAAAQPGPASVAYPMQPPAVPSSNGTPPVPSAN
ncbi:MAG: band 7 protein, partial [Pseudonocardia sp.]|nr:band 7 protein [Pseudonocardia sp.]